MNLTSKVIEDIRPDEDIDTYLRKMRNIELRDSRFPAIITGVILTSLLLLSSLLLLPTYLEYREAVHSRFDPAVGSIVLQSGNTYLFCLGVFAVLMVAGASALVWIYGLIWAIFRYCCEKLLLCAVTEGVTMRAFLFSCRQRKRRLLTKAFNGLTLAFAVLISGYGVFLIYQAPLPLSRVLESEVIPFVRIALLCYTAVIFLFGFSYDIKYMYMRSKVSWQHLYIHLGFWQVVYSLMFLFFTLVTLIPVLLKGFELYARHVVRPIITSVLHRTQVRLSEVYTEVGVTYPSLDEHIRSSMNSINDLLLVNVDWGEVSNIILYCIPVILGILVVSFLFSVILPLLVVNRVKGLLMLSSIAGGAAIAWLVRQLFDTQILFRTSLFDMILGSSLLFSVSLYINYLTSKPRMGVTCSHCGTENPRLAIFCYNCGCKLAGANATALPEP